MIFVTVGTQLPFDRLVRAVDQWAASAGPVEVFAQIGAGGWRPPHATWSEHLTPEAFRERFLEASIIVSHAGIGSILTALDLRKPIVVMPRREHLGEHRNDHQHATARKLCEGQDVPVVEDAASLAAWLETALASSRRRPPVASHASFELLAAVRAFVDGEPHPVGHAELASLPTPHATSPPQSRADAA